MSDDVKIDPAARIKLVYQFRAPGADWMEVDEADYLRIAPMRHFDRRILAVVEEVIKG